MHRRKQITLNAQERAQTLSALASLERKPYHPAGGEFDSPDREAMLLGKDRTVTARDPDLAKQITDLAAQVARLSRQQQRTAIVDQLSPKTVTKRLEDRMEWPAEYAALQISSQSPLGKQ